MSLSNFPTSVDSFITHYDISASDIANVNRYQTLKLQATRTSDEEQELANLTSLLRDKILSVDDFNKLQDSIVSTQQFFKDNVDGYINTKQSEFNAEVDKFDYKGAYNPTVTYYEKNIVSWVDGQTYICLLDNTLNLDPSTTANWALIAQKGAKGDKGDKGDAGTTAVYRGVYSSGTTYNTNDLVTYNGSTYYCTVNGTINIIPTATSNWELFISSGTSTQLVQLTNSVTTSSAVSNVSIGISQFNANTDALLIFKNSTFMYKGIDYNINPNLTSIDIVGGTTWQSGTEFDFIVFKNMQTTLVYTDGSMISDGTITNAKLNSDAKIGSLALLNTTNKADVVSAINELKTSTDANSVAQTNMILMWMGV